MPRKDNIRDYATAAFRYYAAQGKPTYEELREQYFNEALKEYKRTHEKGTNISNPTEQAILYAENKLQQKMAELNDILAVEKTCKQLYPWEKEAVEEVYFREPDNELKKGDIQKRVENTAENVANVDNRTVYRYLAKARSIFAYERGMRK